MEEFVKEAVEEEFVKEAVELAGGADDQVKYVQSSRTRTVKRRVRTRRSVRQASGETKIVSVEKDEKLMIAVIAEKFTEMKKVVIVPLEGPTGSGVARKVMDPKNECDDKGRVMIPKDEAREVLEQVNVSEKRWRLSRSLSVWSGSRT